MPNPKCSSINCVDGPNPMCAVCFPNLREPSPCGVCYNQSKGGTKMCCGRPICNDCFYDQQEDICTLCREVFPGEGVYAGGYFRGYEKGDPFYEGKRTRRFLPREAKLHKVK